MTIVTAHDGTRYRRTGKTGTFVEVVQAYLNEQIRNPTREEPAFVGRRIQNVWTLTEHTRRSAMKKGGMILLDGWEENGEVEFVTLLPRVKWPFPTPGPQFLSAEMLPDSGKPCPVHEGDVLLHHFDGKWTIETLTKERAESNGDLTAWIDWDEVYGDHANKKAQGTWLLARKDPEADA